MSRIAAMTPEIDYGETAQAYYRRSYKTDWLRQCWQQQMIRYQSGPYVFYGAVYEDLVGVFAAIELKLQEIYGEQEADAGGA